MSLRRPPSLHDLPRPGRRLHLPGDHGGLRAHALVRARSSSEQDRWAVVAYVRALQLSQAATLRAGPAGGARAPREGGPMTLTPYQGGRRLMAAGPGRRGRRARAHRGRRGRSTRGARCTRTSSRSSTGSASRSARSSCSARSTRRTRAGRSCCAASSRRCPPRCRSSSLLFVPIALGMKHALRLGGAARGARPRDGARHPPQAPVPQHRLLPRPRRDLLRASGSRVGAPAPELVAPAGHGGRRDAHGLAAAARRGLAPVPRAHAHASRRSTG